MPSELTIITIVVGESKKVMKLQGKWSEKDVKFLLNDGVSSWSGSFDLDSVEADVLSQLNLDQEVYWERMKLALGASPLNSKYGYTFEDGVLCWAKMVTREVSQVHGSVVMREVAPSSQGELVQSLLDSYGSVLEDLSESVARYHRLEREYNDINSAFKECEHIKNEMEATLYAKFAAILNEKKAYVRRMTGKEVDENFGPVPSTSLPKNETAFTRSVSLRELYRMEKRETGGPVEPPSKKQMTEPGPSTSQINFKEEVNEEENMEM